MKYTQKRKSEIEKPINWISISLRRDNLTYTRTIDLMIKKIDKLFIGFEMHWKIEYLLYSIASLAFMVCYCLSVFFFVCFCNICSFRWLDYKPIQDAIEKRKKKQEENYDVYSYLFGRLARMLIVLFQWIVNTSK